MHSGGMEVGGMRAKGPHSWVIQTEKEMGFAIKVGEHLPGRCPRDCGGANSGPFQQALA